MAKVEEEPEIGSLKVKLPAFWPDKPEAWFVQAESNFKARRITSQLAKYHLVVIALDSDTVDGVLDLLEAPPEADPYDQLKAHLVQSFRLSKVDKIKRALEATAPDDENPVKFADKIMASDMWEASGEDISKVVFMLQMPDAVRKTMWSEPLSSWPEMKARASSLWHAEKDTQARGRVRGCQDHRPGGERGTCCTPGRRRRAANSRSLLRSFQQRQGGSMRVPRLFREVIRQVSGTLFAGGKRRGRAAVAAVSAGSLTLHDATSNRSFLVDTGAEVSVVPASEEERQRAPMQKQLVAANGSQIRCYGEKKLRLQVGTRSYEWKFLVAEVRRPLIGADFLTHTSLLVDLKNRQLIHPEELSAVPLRQSKRQSRITGLAFAAPENPSPLTRLFSEFPAITVPNFKLEHPKHGVRHVIETRGQPIRAKARPLPPQKLAAARANFAELAAAGIVRRANGPWSSPLHVVTKKDGSFRMCGDYRRLNSVTTPDRYSIPLIADLTARLHGRKVFGKVDLVKGYHQIPVAEEDIPKTAITTPFGTFEYLRMPFGLKNAGQTFQRMMDEILSDLEFAFIYMDDVLIASRSMEEHTEHFRVLFRRLADHDLVLSPAKCQFGQSRIEFLGHTVSKDGIEPLPEKVAAISQFPKPSTTEELK